MKNKKNTGRILLMMIASQVMLILLIAYWLRSQYIEERTRLKERITSIYIETREEFLDTMIFRNLVKPVISEDKKWTYIPENLDTLKGKSHIFKIAVSDTNAPGRNRKSETRKFVINDKKDTALHVSGTVAVNLPKDNFLLRSIRMVVSNINDTLSDPGHAMAIFVRVDSNSFRKQISHRINNEGMKLNVLIHTSHDSINAHPGKKVMLIDPTGPIKLPAVQINKYTWFLLGKILPQILFAVVLFLITALAFYLSYKNLNEQIILNTVRNDFISNITHELKTPVAALSASLESLGKYNMSNDPAILREYLNLAAGETQRLEELINRVLDLSLLEAEDQAIIRNETDLAALIIEIVARFKMNDQQATNLTTTIKSDVLKVRCDKLLIKGAIINLIDNSIKYGGKDSVINITAWSENDVAFVEVRDNGPGIPEEYSARIFDKFFRVPAGNIHNVKGYGLGLSYVKLVMRLHKGTVEMRNLQPGCAFTLRFPC